MVYDVNDFMNKPAIHTQIKSIQSIKNRGKNKLEYLEVYSGFDIETTTLENHHAYMYHWQFSFNDDVICGRLWTEFDTLIRYLIDALHLTRERRLIVFVANLGFEFQFIRKRFYISDMFAKEQRQPLYFLLENAIEFHECLTITGGNLAYLAKNYCATQKMVGDLDYSIKRNSTTPLTEKELNYCYNDVIILSEFSKYIFDTYIKPDKFVPLTKTGIIRREVKNGFPYKAHEIIRSCYPSRKDYKIYMAYLFRGGFCHANILHTNRKIYGVASIDFTSSYPAVMNYSLYPMSPFISKEPTLENLHKYIKTHCCIIHAVFKNIRATTPHSIESSSKAINIYNGLFDNGRIRKADLLEVMLTDLDYKIYKMFYQWDEITTISLKTSVRGKLPGYLLNPLNKAYIKKNELKIQGLSDTPEYANTKSSVNSCFGMCVTRLCESEIIYDTVNDEWSSDSSSFDYNKEVKKAFLLPQWGIWVTANARYNLLSQVYKISKRSLKLKHYKTDVLYCDTDSIKLINYDAYKDIIDAYNKGIDKLRSKTNLASDHFNDLGKWDLEYTECTSKLLGAKRYITTFPDGKTKVTVAGLPKHSLSDYCKKNNKDIYEVFTDKMLLNTEISFKTASSYNDNYHEDVVNGELMSEESSCGIYAIDFTMKLQPFYLYLLQKMQEENEKYERRNNG